MPVGVTNGLSWRVLTESQDSWAVGIWFVFEDLEFTKSTFWKRAYMSCQRWRENSNAPSHFSTCQNLFSIWLHCPLPFIPEYKHMDSRKGLRCTLIDSRNGGVMMWLSRNITRAAHSESWMAVRIHKRTGLSSNNASISCVSPRPTR